MKSYQRFLLFLLLVLFLTSLLSPWVAALWDLIIQDRPEWRGLRYPFSSIFDRLFMIVGVILFLLFRPALRIGSARDLGLLPLREGGRDFVWGILLALGSLAALVLVMSLTHVFTPYFRLAPSVAAARFFKALLSALTVGLLEEIFFRGIIFKGLMQDWKPPAAFVATNLFYSAIHFVKPAERIFLSGIEPWAGVRHVLYSFQTFLDPTPILPGLFGLFLIGVVLSYAFLRTGSLYLSIGLHAGWILGLKTIRIFGDYRREDLGWLFGSLDPKFVSGMATWIGILLVGVVVHWITPRRRAQF